MTTPRETKDPSLPPAASASLPSAAPLDSKRETKKPSEALSSPEYWKSLLDNYEIEDKKRIETPEESHTRAHAILGDNGIALLHRDVKAEKTARTRFIDHLVTVLANRENDIKLEADDDRASDPSRFTTSIEQLLGKRGVELYKQAIEEERNSAAYRDAVFLQATKHYKGPKWNEKMVLWVGGPSASGKSFAADEIVKKVDAMEKEKKGDAGNYVVAIDGGIEREVSQMRQLVLQAALKKGFSGIEDLEKNTKLKMKRKIQQAALSKEDLNLVIPCTFSDYVTQTQQKKIKRFAKLPNTKQIFSKIVGGKTRAEKDRFQRSVFRMGNSRAWSSKFGEAETTARVITINNRCIGCESKKYGKKGFKYGKTFSAWAREKYKAAQKKNNKDRIYLTITNDLMFIHQTASGEWVECEESYRGTTVALTFRAYQAWLREHPKGTPAELKIWLDAHKEYSTAQVDVEINDENTRYIGFYKEKHEIENTLYEWSQNELEEDTLRTLIRDNPVYFLYSQFRMGEAAKKINEAPYYSRLKNICSDVLKVDTLSDLNRVLFNDVNLLAKINHQPARCIKNFAECMLARFEMLNAMSERLHLPAIPLSEAETLTKEKIANLIPYLKNIINNDGTFNIEKTADRTVVMQILNSAYKTVHDYAGGLLANPALKINEAQLVNVMRVSGSITALNEQTVYVENVKKLADRDNAISKLNNELKEADKLLGILLINDLKKPGDSNQRAIDTLFDIVNQLELSAKESFYTSLNTHFDIDLANLNAAQQHLNDAKNEEEKKSAKQRIQVELAQIISTLKIHADATNELKWRFVLGSIPPDPLNGINIFEQPVSTVDSPHPRHEDIRKGMSRNIQHYRYVASKGAGGAQESGPLGGWYIGCYKTPDGKIHTQRFMFKREGKHRKNIIESLGGRLKTSLVNVEQDYVAGTFMVRDPYATDMGVNSYAASIGFDDFQETHKLVGIRNRVKMAGTCKTVYAGDARKIYNNITRLHDQENYPGLEESLIASWFTGDTDVHSANIGVSTQSKCFLNIDHAGSMLKLEPEIHPNRYSLWHNMKRLFSREPTHHAAEYDYSIRCSEKMAEAIKRCTSRMTFFDIKTIVEDEISKTTEHFKHDFDEFKRFAERVGVPKSARASANSIEKMAEVTKSFLTEILYARLVNLRQYGREIELSFCFKYDQKKNIIVDDEKITRFVRENPNYCLQEKHHFRGKWHFGDRTALNKKLKEKTNEVISQNEKTGVAQFIAPNVNNPAVNYLTQMRLIKQILADEKQFDHNPFKNKIDELIEFLEKYNSPTSSRKQHLVQNCDSAYITIQKIFETLSAENDQSLRAKIQIFEMLKNLHENPQLLKEFDRLSNEVPKKHNHREAAIAEKFKESALYKQVRAVSIDRSAFSQSVKDAAEYLARLSTHAQYSHERRKNVDVLKEKQESIAKLHEKLAALAGEEKTNLDKIAKHLQHASEELKSKSADELAMKQEYFTTTRELHKQADKTFMQQAAEHFGHNMTTAPSNTAIRTEEKSTVGSIATEDKAILLENPGNNAGAGAVVISENNSTKIIDFEDPTISFANLLAEELLASTSLDKGEMGLRTLRKYIQENYIDILQRRYPPETVTKENLFRDLIKPMMDNKNKGFDFVTPSNPMQFFSKKTSFSDRVYDQFHKKISWHPQLLCWVNVWMKTLEAKGLNPRDVQLENTRGNPEFMRLLLICLCSKGADIYRTNRTGYQFLITPADIARMKDIMENPDNLQHAIAMGKSVDFQYAERKLERETATFKEPQELTILLKRINQHLDQPLPQDKDRLRIMRERVDADRLQLQRLDREGQYMQLYKDIPTQLNAKISAIDARIKSIRP